MDSKSANTEKGKCKNNRRVITTGKAHKKLCVCIISRLRLPKYPDVS